MRCSTLYSLAATALLALSVQAVPYSYPTATLAIRDYTLPTGTIARRAAVSTGFLDRREAQPTNLPNVMQRKNLAPSGIFNAAPTGSISPRRDATASSPPYPIRDTSNDDEQTEASCFCTNAGKAPIYTINIPSSMASTSSFGPGCPALGFIDAMQKGSEPIFGFGCKANGDGGVTLTLSSSGRVGGAIDAALRAVTVGGEAWADQCSLSGCE